MKGSTGLDLIIFQNLDTDQEKGKNYFELHPKDKIFKSVSRLYRFVSSLKPSHWINFLLLQSEIKQTRNKCKIFFYWSVTTISLSLIFVKSAPSALAMLSEWKWEAFFGVWSEATALRTKLSRFSASTFHTFSFHCCVATFACSQQDALYFELAPRLINCGRTAW